jgi:hypothetical protein
LPSARYLTLILVFGVYTLGQTFSGEDREHEAAKQISKNEHIIHELKENEKLEKMTEIELEVYLSKIEDVD